MSNEPPHKTVLLDEAIQWLNIRQGLSYVDATAGAGGHLTRIAEAAGAGATVFGIDRDTTALSNLERQPALKNVRLIHGNFSDIGELLHSRGIDTVSGGILADLGVSSMQLDNADRGFSFMHDGPLDMRMDPTAPMSAADLINRVDERELADIIYKYGEERHSREIARRIIAERPIKTTRQLSELVSKVVQRYRRRGAKDESHPATRTFQALRIAVNEELSSLEQFLKSSVDLLKPGGRLVVITFHSLEDRIVKQFLKDAASSCICPPRYPICTCQKEAQVKILTPKPLLPETSEILANPRSRSAKLRAGEKLARG